MEKRRKVTRLTKVSSPLQYRGYLFFLILFLIIWPPLGVLLLIRHACISVRNSKFYLVYHGSWGWLYFWGILFFPVAIVLLFVKGVDLIDETVVDEQTVIERS
ncbi:MAG: hypothetical protein K2Y18_06385 [Alphaproteobacteria bacterium]|jgi:hypothetical protein|nr:hypothetical protein [Alphaproteobacteria bacterium]